MKILIGLKWKQIKNIEKMKQAQQPNIYCEKEPLMQETNFL